MHAVAATLLLHSVYLSCSFSEPTQGFGGRPHTVSERRHITVLAVHRNACHRFSQDLHRGRGGSRTDNKGRERRFRVLSSEWADDLGFVFVFFNSLGLFDLKGNLRVLHHALDAVEVGQVTDGLVGIVQHSSDSLPDRWETTCLTASINCQANHYR